jgi:hypothetical protein
MAPETLETIHGLLMYFLGIQVIYSFLILVFGNLIYDVYDVGIYHNPSNIFQKTFNFVVNFFFGLGPYIYRRLLKYPWILRKIYMLIATAIMLVISIILYYILKNVLDFILLGLFG